MGVDLRKKRVDSPHLDRVVDVEIVITDTEREALVLENRFIKTHKPRFNVVLGDDKNHPMPSLPEVSRVLVSANRAR